MGSLPRGNFNVFLLILLVVLAVFGKSIFFGYIHLDEDMLITGNDYFYKSSSAFVEVFKHDAYFPSGISAYYRPFYVLSFMADTYLGGSPGVFHSTNIILHVLASFLVFVFIKKLQVLGKSKNDASSSELALFLSLIFAVHPIITQAVSWVPARGDTLLAVFLLSSIIYLSDYLLKQRGKYVIGHLIFFFLALFTKETAFIFPVIGIFYVYCLAGKRIFNYAGTVLVSGWVLLSAFWFLLRRNALSAVSIEDASLTKLLEIVFNNISAVPLYIGKMLLPVNLSVFPLMRDSSLVFGIIAVGVLVFYLIWNRSNLTKYSFIGFVWLILFLIPVILNYDDPGQMAFFEHRAYLPFIGFLILILDLNLKLNHKYAKIFSVGIVSLLALVTYSYNLNFQNRAVFWREAVKMSPNSARAHAELAVVYSSEKNLLEAEQEFKKALELNPKEKNVNNNLALFYIKQNQLDTAEHYLKKELEVDSGSVIANFNLGNIYARQNKFKEALSYWQEALKTNPSHILTHESLIKYYYLQKNTEKILYHLNEITRREAPLSQEIKEIFGNHK